MNQGRTKKNSTFLKGFTLIELLVTTGIISILVTIGLASYNRFNERQILIQAASDLKNNLRLVQNKAMTGEKVCGAGACGGTNNICDNEAGEKPLSGWKITFAADSYTINGVCEETEFSDKTYNLASGISISPLPSPVTFLSLTKGVSNQAIICLNGFSQIYKITVSSNGEIIDDGLKAVCQ